MYVFSVNLMFMLPALIWKNRKDIHRSIVFLFGSVSVFGAFALWLLANRAIDQFFFQTILFPRMARNPVEGLFVLIGQYTSYLSMIMNNIDETAIFFGSIVFIIWVISVGARYTHRNVIRYIGYAVILVIVGYQCVHQYFLTDPRSYYNTYVLFFWCTLTAMGIGVSLVGFFDKHSVRDGVIVLLPIILIASSHATFLSHGIVDSSYHMWPLAIVLIGYIVSMLETRLRMVPWKLICIVPVFVLLLPLRQAIVADYAFGYIDTTGVPVASTVTVLSGLTVPGQWSQQFQQLVTYVSTTIPQNESVAFFPGEDPFFSATNRDNPLQFSLLHAGVYTLQPSTIVTELREKQVDWIIVKKQYQTLPQAWINNIDQIMESVQMYYTKAAEIPNYDIYKRNK